MQEEDVPRPACKGSSKTCTPPWSQDSVGPSRCDRPRPSQAPYPQQQGLNLAPTGALCPGRVKGIRNTTLRDCLGTWWLFPTITGTVPSLSAPSLVHQRFSAKSPSGGRLLSLRLFPMQQPTKVRAARSRASSVLSMATSTRPIPVSLENSSSEGAITAASIHPVPPHWCHHKHHPDKVN